MTPLKRPEYIRINIRDIPDKIIKEYKLKGKTDTKVAVFIVANRDMYGLPQSGLLANELLEKQLNKLGYQQSKLVPGLWKHDWRPIKFTLVVENFGVKYVVKEHALRLKQTLEESYKVTTEWDVTGYTGIMLDLDYKRIQVHLFLPGYTDKSLKQFNHTKKKNQNQPYPSAPIIYGAKKQYATQPSAAPLLDNKGGEIIQQVCGSFFFSEEPSTALLYSQAVPSHHNLQLQPKRK